MAAKGFAAPAEPRSDLNTKESADAAAQLTPRPELFFHRSDSSREGQE